jgi:hypothetical protein
MKRQNCLQKGTTVDIGSPRTNKSKRKIAIVQLLALDIKRLMHQNKVNRARLGPEYKNMGLLNCHLDGSPFTNDEFRYDYEKHVEL